MPSNGPPEHARPGIADYGFLSDCATAALIDRAGSLDWWCLPRFDSPSVFGRLFGPEAGHWTLRPVQESTTTWDYLEDTLVLRTEHTTAGGVVAVTDALAMEPGARGHEMGLRSPRVVLRRVEGLSGTVEMASELAPRPEYGRTEPHWRHVTDGVEARGGPVRLTCTGPVHWTLNEGSARTAFVVTAGDTVELRLSATSSFTSEPALHDADEQSRPSIHDTVLAWRWCGRGAEHTESDHARTLARRHAPASRPGCSTGSPPPPGTSAMNWCRSRTGWRGNVTSPKARSITSPATATARPSGSETVRGSRPSSTCSARSSTRRTCCATWSRTSPRPSPTCSWRWQTAPRARGPIRTPACGRPATRSGTTRPRRCCAGSPSTAPSISRPAWVSRADPQTWAAAREKVRLAVLEQAWSEKIRAYAGAFGSDDLDASVLVLPLVGFLPMSDERMAATVEAVASRLGEQGLVRRWASDESGFLICTYWLVECLAMGGQADRAQALFRLATSHANDLGLLAEEADPGTGEALGNVPQAFSHVGLINAAWRLAHPG